MTDYQFRIGLGAGPELSSDRRFRLRDLVAAAIQQRAIEHRRAGRRTLSGRLGWASGQLLQGRSLSSKVLESLSADLDIIRVRLVDGKPV